VARYGGSLGQSGGVKDAGWDVVTQRFPETIKRLDLLDCCVVAGVRDIVPVANATRFSCAFGTGSDWPTEAYSSCRRVRLVPQEILEPMDIVLAVLHV
jgi:hypothetical protein